MFCRNVAVDVNKKLLSFLDEMDKQVGEQQSVRYAIN